MKDIPEFVEEGAKIEALGAIYSKTEPFLVVTPKSSSIVFDLGSLVLAPASNEVVGFVRHTFP